MFSAVTDDQQAQQSSLGFFANAQNTLITGGSFIVGLAVSVIYTDFSTNFIYRVMSIFSLLDLVKCR